MEEKKKEKELAKSRKKLSKTMKFWCRVSGKL
jgi:hypothetical protein